MAYNLRVVKTSDFIRYDGRGQTDRVRSRRILERIAKACVDSEMNCALLDVRDLHSHLELKDLYSLINAFKDMGFRREHRLAILHSYRGTHKADFFAMCASARGWNVRAFDSFEDAMEWFATEQEIQLSGSW